MFITPVNSRESNLVRYKYDVTVVPASFFGDEVLLGEINALIVKLGRGLGFRVIFIMLILISAPLSGERCNVCLHVVK